MRIVEAEDFWGREELGCKDMTPAVRVARMLGQTQRLDWHQNIDFLFGGKGLKGAGGWD